MTTTTLIDTKAESDAEVVGKISYMIGATLFTRDVTRGEASLAFDVVADKANWKMPINKVVDLDPYLKALIAHAVTFFAGSVAKFERIGGTTTSGIGRYRVTARGYYADIGA